MKHAVQFPPPSGNPSSLVTPSELSLRRNPRFKMGRPTHANCRCGWNGLPWLQANARALCSGPTTKIEVQRRSGNIIPDPSPMQVPLRWSDRTLAGSGSYAPFKGGREWRAFSVWLRLQPISQPVRREGSLEGPRRLAAWAARCAYVLRDNPARRSVPMISAPRLEHPADCRSNSHSLYTPLRQFRTPVPTMTLGMR